MIKSLITDRHILKIPCESVKLGEDISQIIKDLEDTLPTLKGYALAANQIGYSKKVSLMNVKNSKTVLINPQILKKDKKFIHKSEGCLSFPGLRLDTDRFLNITFQTGVDKIEVFNCEDLEAVVVQHEVDHLNGVLIFDRKHKAR